MYANIKLLLKLRSEIAQPCGAREEISDRAKRKGDWL